MAQKFTVATFGMMPFMVGCRQMELIQPVNEKVLAYLARAKRAAPVVAAFDAGPDPYYRCGCHPEIVERLWDQIGAALPVDCRCLLYGVPALVAAGSRVILAVGLGTQYGLRLAPRTVVEARAAGAPLTTTWSGGQVMSVQAELGLDWVFGAWLPGEIGWSRELYALVEAAK